MDGIGQFSGLICQLYWLSVGYDEPRPDITAKHQSNTTTNEIMAQFIERT